MTYLFFASASIFRLIEYWSISNEPFWAKDLAIGTAVSTVVSLIIVRYSKNLGIMIFFLTFFMELFGNVFYSYHWLTENQTVEGTKSFFSYWCEMNVWIYELFFGSIAGYEEEYNMIAKTITVWLQGSFAPLMQMITFLAIQKIMKISDTETTEAMILNPEGMIDIKDEEIDENVDIMIDRDIDKEGDNKDENSDLFENSHPDTEDSDSEGKTVTYDIELDKPKTLASLPDIDVEKKK